MSDELPRDRIRDHRTCHLNFLELLHRNRRDLLWLLAIANGSATTAIVGASDAPIFPLSFGAFCALGALTRRNTEPTKASRPYDALSDGIVIAEGAATLILEDLEAARDRGATIYAEILGHGAASEAIGMRKGDVSGHAMATAIAMAIRNAHLCPQTSTT